MASQFVNAASVKRVLKIIEKEDYAKAEKLVDEELFNAPEDYNFLYLKAKLLFESSEQLAFVENAFEQILLAEKALNKNGEDPKGIHPDEVYVLKAQIEKRYVHVLNKKTEEELNKFANKHPNSSLSSYAQSLMADKELRDILQSEDLNKLEEFIINNPENPELESVITLRDELAFEKALHENTIEVYEHFMENYPEAEQYKEAENHRNNLAYIELLQKTEKLNTLTIQEQKNQIQQEKAAQMVLAAEAKTLWVSVSILALLAFTVSIGMILIRRDRVRIINQKQVIEFKNNQIFDSINYAQKIQQSMLPTESALSAYVNDVFVIYRPKDIVSGDFYWCHEKDENIYLAVADCTGHGVPGSMISMMGINGLNSSLNDFGLNRPDEILNKLREKIVKAFRKEDNRKDGMDISLCRIDKSKNMLQFSGAHNNLYIIRNGELLELKADRQAIGYQDNMKDFCLHEMELLKGDKLYLFTDGYIDQFGGEKGRKLMKKAFKTLLVQYSKLSMSEMKYHLDRYFDEWKGSENQLDDVCVMGVEV